MMWLMIWLSAVIIYIDAIRRGIFRIRGERGLLNLSPTGWFYCVLLFWLVGFPLYLVHSGRIETKCRQTRESMRGHTTSFFVAFMNILLTFLVIVLMPGFVE